MRLFLLLLAVGAVGCGTRASKGTVSLTQKVAEDPWPTAVAGLRKETTPGGLGRYLAELTGAAAADPKYAPDGLPAAAEPTLKELARLTDDDLKALRPSGYSALDPHYLAECQYLRDVARTLDADGLPPDQQADRAFAWVCRQVVLAPWVAPGRSPGEALFLPPVPPAYVLRRGSGSGLERAYVFAALCRQLGIDAVLVGPADAADKTWRDDQPSGQPPKGPFWAVGARAGGDVKLYDPWRGVPLGTLAQAMQTPDAVKESAPADRVKASGPFLTVNLSSLAPRLKRLEAELKTDAPRLYVDLPAAVKAFADATKLSPKVWNSPADTSGPARGLANFLPVTEGGAADPQRFQAFRVSLIPVGAIRLPPAVDKLAADSAALQLPVEGIRNQAYGRYSRHFLNAPAAAGGTTARTDIANIGKMLEQGNQPEQAEKPQQQQQGAAMPLENLPTVRERLHRRLLPNAVPGLVDLRKELTAADDRLRADPLSDARLATWAGDAKQVYGAFLRSMDRAGGGPNPAELANFAKLHGKTMAALEDAAAVPVELAEATFLIALAMHEQAASEQSRADRQNTDAARRRAADGWAEARGWWERYAPFADANDAVFPGRAALARRLTGEATR